MEATPKYCVRVRLSGRNGNAFAILAQVRKALQKHGVPEQEIKEFVREATSGNYNHLLQVCMSTVIVR